MVFFIKDRSSSLSSLPPPNLALYARETKRSISSSFSCRYRRHFSRCGPKLPVRTRLLFLFLSIANPLCPGQSTSGNFFQCIFPVCNPSTRFFPFPEPHSPPEPWAQISDLLHSPGGLFSFRLSASGYGADDDVFRGDPGFSGDDVLNLGALGVGEG